MTPRPKSVGGHGNVPGNWDVVLLPNVTFFQEGPGLRKWQWTDSGMKVINVTNILADSQIDIANTNRFISMEEFTSTYSHFAVDDGDIVIASSGNTYGKIGRISAKDLPLMMNTSVIRLHSGNTKRLDDDFLYVFLRSEVFRSQIESFVTGSAQPNFGPSHLKQMLMPLPPLPVQRRIAGILSAYDELMENSQRRIRILEEMARALFREWFVHFRFPDHDNFPHVPSSLGDIPRGWEVRPLGEIATITMGLSPKGDTYNEQGNGTPLVNGPVEFGERFTKQVKWTTAPTKFCKEGDLVVCVGGSTTGKYVKSDGVYCLGRGVCGLSSNYQCFVDLLFGNELRTLLAKTGGSTFPSWTGPQLKSHPVLSPPPELLARFEEFVQPMSAAVLRYSRKIENLRRTRDLLLPHLLSGQVENLVCQTE